MNSPNGILLSYENYKRIAEIINVTDSNEKEKLREELERATVLKNEDIPHDVVTMNSEIVFKDLKNNRESTVMVVFPQDANIEQQKISVLAPIGAALIGLRVGQQIEWPLPSGEVRRIEVTRILFQPEAENSLEASKELK